MFPSSETTNFSVLPSSLIASTFSFALYRSSVAIAVSGVIFTHKTLVPKKLFMRLDLPELNPPIIGTKSSWFLMLSSS